MIEENYRLKIAAISGASKALKCKAENPKFTDEDVLRFITKMVGEIIEKIDEEEF